MMGFLNLNDYINMSRRVCLRIYDVDGRCVMIFESFSGHESF